MNERHNELGAVLAEVRRRWTRRSRLGAWSVGAFAAATVLAVGLLAVWLVASEGLPLAIVALGITALVLVTLVAAARPLRQPPSDLQLARFIEEQAGGLDDVVVTAVAHGDKTTPIAALLSTDAARAVERIGLDAIVSRETLRRAAIAAVAATVALAVGAIAFAPSVKRGAAVATAYLLPSRILIEVTPGTTKVREGRPVTITTTLHGLDDGLVPELVTGSDEQASAVRMEPTGTPGQYALTIEAVSASFPYFVSAGRVRSDDYAIEAIRPARVRRIDLRYRYPRPLGLEPRVEEDGGDIYGPAGTSVELTVTTDKPVARGALTLADGTKQDLQGNETTLSAALDIRADGSYRVALSDVDSLENPGDTEYFIRMIDDRPPDVRVLRPGGDKQVTPLEEVVIEARADDDFGLSAFELVFQKPGGKDTVIPFPAGRALAATGSHQILLEDLGVKPGDFVTYHARARDVGQGRRGTESRSDIFFLEVKPFEEAFVAAQSQAMGMQAGGSGLQDLAEAQKEIIAATWKLDARARRSRDAKSESDIKAVSQAQTALRSRAAEAAGQVANALSDPRRRRARPGQSAAPGGDDPMTRAIEAMGRATGELDRMSTSGALPHEMEALEQLLKADADVQKRQVARQQQAGGGGGSNRQAPDLSTLFDQQLRKQQQTNYETPTNTETREERSEDDDPLARIRELARRQEALQRAQRDLARDAARLSEDERKRQLERLTREQQELTEQADDLSRQVQQSRQNASNDTQSEPQSQRGQSSGQQPGSSSSGSQPGASQGQSSRGRQLRDIAEQMKEAAGDLRRQDPQQASAKSGQAVEQLRELSREMERSRPDEQRRAMGDLQFEARQLAEAERRLANETERTSAGQAGDDTRRRLAAEQERLAERTERLRETAKDVAGQSGSGGDAEQKDLQEAARQAADDIARQRLAERMRESAGALRQPKANAGGQGEKGRDMARALDRIAGQLGAASGARDSETERLSEQLARTNELRDRVEGLQRSLQELDREARQGQQGGKPSSDAQGQPGSQGQPNSSSATPQGNEGREGSSGEQAGGDGGRAGRLADLQRETSEQMKEARQLAGELRQQNPDMRNGTQTPEDWWPSLSAPGTESFKQDFSRWESLKKNLLVALDRTETRLSGQLREREARDRLNAGGHEGVSEAYREMVDRYYQSLATPRKLPR